MDKIDFVEECLRIQGLTKLILCRPTVEEYDRYRLQILRSATIIATTPFEEVYVEVPTTELSLAVDKNG